MESLDGRRGGAWRRPRGSLGSARAALLVSLLALAPLGALAQKTGAAGCDPGERVIRFSHVVVAEGHPKGEAASLLATEINRELDGRFCMEVYPDSTLFDDGAVLDALIRGDVEIAAPSLSKFEGATKAFRIFDLPFLFRDLRAVEWFQNSGPGRRLMRKLDGTGLKGLAFWNNGMKQISADRPLLRPEDAKGVTFRIQASAVLEALFRQIGAKTKKLPFKAVRDALESGEVQGQENSWANIRSKGFYKFQDGVTESNHGLLAYLVVTSDRFWDSLALSDRAALNRILASVTARANLQAQALAQENYQALERQGVVLRKLTDADREAWVAAMRPVWDRFAREIGPDFIEAGVVSNR